METAERTFVRPPRPNTRCARRYCRQTLNEHGADGECPSRPTRLFCYYPPKGSKTGRLSNSFTPAEAEAFAGIIQGLLRKQDLTQLAKGPVFASLARKVTGMAARARQARAGNGAA